MPLTQLIYCSRPCRVQGQAIRISGLREIVDASIARNRALDVTGFLVLRDDIFLQVLEGEEAVVTDLYAKIARDPRHEACQILGTQRIMMRHFAGWAMGGLLMSPEQEGIYLQHGVGSVFKPATMGRQALVNLLTDLMGHAAKKGAGA